MTEYAADDFAAIAAKLKELRQGKEPAPAVEQPKTAERSLEDYMDSLDYSKNSSGY